MQIIMAMDLDQRGELEAMIIDLEEENRLDTVTRRDVRIDSIKADRLFGGNIYIDRRSREVTCYIRA